MDCESTALLWRWTMADNKFVVIVVVVVIIVVGDDDDCIGADFLSLFVESI